MKLGLLEIVQSLVKENGINDREMVETVCYLLNCSEKRATLTCVRGTND